MKKFITLFLLIALSVTLLSACDKGKDDTSTPSDAVSTDETSQVVDPDLEWKDANGNWVPKHEVKDLTGNTFTIAVKGEGVGTYQSEDFTTESTLYGDLLNDAVKERNNKVEELYHIELVVDKRDDYMTAIRNDVQSQLGTYDAIMPSLKELAVLTSEDALVELTSIKGLDLSAPWYDQNATEAFSIRNHIYFTTGDITILNKVCAPSVLFGKDLVNKFNLDNPYQLVRDHEWTFDKLVEMGKSVSSVTSEDVYQNTYGLLAAYADPFVFYGASGETITIKDGNDLPVLSIGKNQRSVTIAQKVLDEYANGDSWMIFSNNRTYFKDFTDALNIFAQGHVLFRESGFSATTKLRKMADASFGILPLPLMDETQEDYVSYCSGTAYVAGIAIPASAKDIEFSAYMIDAYSAYAKNYITHAYYDVNLYQKDARDDESEEMLDIIFSNIVYDMGECFNFGKIVDAFSGLASSRTSDIVSRLEAISSQAEQEIQELVESYGRDN